MNVKELRQLDIMHAIRDMMDILAHVEKLDVEDKVQVREGLFLGISYLLGIFLSQFGKDALLAYPETTAKITDLLAVEHLPNVVLHESDPLADIVALLRWSIASYKLTLTFDLDSIGDEITSIVMCVNQFHNCVLGEQ